MKDTNEPVSVIDVQHQVKLAPAAATANSSCGICGARKLPQLPCKGHADIAGGDDDAAIAEYLELMDELAEEAATAALVDETEEAASKDDDTDFETNEPSYHELYDVHGLFNTDIISDMLADKLLEIDNNLSLRTLNIRLTCKPEWLSTQFSYELRKFIDVLLKELEEFKKEFGLTDNCLVILKDSQGNFLGLKINMPTLGLHHEFLTRLSEKNLLPEKSIKQVEKPNFEKGVNHFSARRSAPRLSYSRRKKNEDNDDDREENTYRSPSPFSTTLTRK